MNVLRISCAVFLLSLGLVALSISTFSIESFEGRIQYSKIDDALYLVNDTHRVELLFTYDLAKELIIDDFDEVVVTGVFIKVLNFLRVEEIEMMDQRPSLACAEI